jgi:hypothetical protein
MIRNILQSIGAFLAAVLVTFALSYGTDFILQSTGILPRGNLYVAWLLIVMVIAYRSVYNAIGGYIASRLAPNHPMGHALALGVLGFVGSVVSTIATLNMRLGPVWYPLTIAVLSIPSTLVGWKLSTLRQKRRTAAGHTVLRNLEKEF